MIEAANNTTLLIKEVLYIHLTDTGKLMNRDKGITTSDCWMAVMSRAMTLASAASSSTYVPMK